MSGLRRRPAKAGRPATRERARAGGRRRAWAAEAAIILVLGLILTACSLGLLALRYGVELQVGIPGLLNATAAGIGAATVVRVTVRLHRGWKKTVGRVTAAAALCSIAAVAGALLVMIPGECPGTLPHMGRCGVKEAAAWGEAAGMAAVVNFMVAGFTLALFRGVRGTVRDAWAQGTVWAMALSRVLRRRGGRQADRPRDPQASKGRPTRRRADAERARRERLRRA